MNSLSRKIALTCWATPGPWSLPNDHCRELPGLVASLGPKEPPPSGRKCLDALISLMGSNAASRGALLPRVGYSDGPSTTAAVGSEPRAGEPATDTLLRNSVISLLGGLATEKSSLCADTVQKIPDQPESRRRICGACIVQPRRSLQLISDPYINP